VSTPEALFRNAIDLNRYSNSVARRLINAYNDIILDAVDQLRAIDELAAPVKAARLRAIIAQLRDSLSSWAGDATELTAIELQGLAELQSEFVAEQLRQVLPAGVRDAVRTVEISPQFAQSVVTTDPTQINVVALSDDLYKSVYGTEALARQAGAGVFNLTAAQGTMITLPNGEIVRKAFRGIAVDQAERFSQVVRNGLLTGEPTPAIAKRLKGTLQRSGDRLQFGEPAITAGQRRAAGIKDTVARGGDATRMADNQILTLVRTSVNQVANAASQQVYEANQDITRKYRYVATLDSRTSAQCFFGSTNIVPFGTVKKVFRRWYSGEVAVITTASGQELIGTVNHPVLTANGWRSLQELKPSEDVIYRVLGEGGTLTLQNVDMPASIASIADPLFEPSIFPVLRAGSSPEQFHGDGMGLDGEVDIALIENGLSADLSDSGLGQQIKEFLFGPVHVTAPSPCGDHCADGFVGRGQSSVTMKSSVSIVEGFVDKALAAGAAELPVDLRNREPLGIKLGGKVGVGIDEAVSLAAAEDWHDAEPLQQCCDRRGSGAVIPADLRSRGALSVKADDVVSVRIEHRAGHVYNVETSSSIYAADGFIVHNCRALDGKVFDYGKGPTPPVHWNCRSVTVPVIDYKQLSEDFGFEVTPPPAGRRAAAGGPVPADMTYGEWLAKQDAATQAKALGDSKVPYFNMLAKKHGPQAAIAKLVRDDGRELTLAELRKRYGNTQP